METMDTNDEICGHHDDANGADDSGIISDLLSTTEVPAEDELKAKTKEVEVTVEIKEAELKAEINQQQLNERNQHNENVRVTDQNNELMKILLRKDKRIESMETQLQSAVSAKLDALARLETIQAKELTLRFKEKQMDLDAERVSNKIENITDNLNKTFTELMAVRQDLASASAQFEIEMRMANLNRELSETNQMLKTQNEEYAYKLQQQLNESGKLMELYEMDLKAKIELAELYKQNSDDYQAQVDELTAGITELKQLLYEVVNGYGMLETKIKEIQLDRRAESDAKDGIILKLKQELQDANRLLKTYRNCDDNAVDFPISNNHPVVKGMTFTEMYTQYCSVAKELQHKEQEYEILEGEMKNLMKDVTEKAIQFNQQQNELKNLQSTNDKSIEKLNLVRKMVGRVELENTRSRCELLTAENNELKSLLKCYETDCLKKLFSMPNNRGMIAKLAHPATVELEKQNQQLLLVVDDLNAKIKEMNSVEVLTSEIYEVSEGNVCTRDISNVKSQEAKLEELAQKNTKLQADVQKLSAKKILLVAEANLFNVRNNVSKNRIQTLEEQNQKYASLMNETNIANKKRSAASTSTSTGCSKRLRSMKKPRVEFLDLSEDCDEDEIINICDDDESGESQLLSEVRTQQQAKFILDGLYVQKTESSVNVKTEAETLNDKKVSHPKRARSHSSRRSRSSTRAGRTQSSSRSRSVPNARAFVGQASDSRCKGVVINRRSHRLMSRARRAML